MYVFKVISERQNFGSKEVLIKYIIQLTFAIFRWSLTPLDFLGKKDSLKLDVTIPNLWRFHCDTNSGFSSAWPKNIDLTWHSFAKVLDVIIVITTSISNNIYVMTYYDRPSACEFATSRRSWVWTDAHPRKYLYQNRENQVVFKGRSLQPWNEQHMDQYHWFQKVAKQQTYDNHYLVGNYFDVCYSGQTMQFRHKSKRCLSFLPLNVRRSMPALGSNEGIGTLTSISSLLSRFPKTFNIGEFQNS